MQNWKKSWWNPFWWLKEIGRAVLGVLADILRFFGISVPQPRPPHQNIQPSDIQQAYDEAAAAETLPQPNGSPVDAAVRGFIRYVNAPAEERAAFDLGVFSQDQQDFILSLSEADIEELRSRGPVGQIQAALICRIPPHPIMDPEQETTPRPTKAELVRERFLREMIGRASKAAAEPALPEFSPFRAL